jgi:hypothetical protein
MVRIPDGAHPMGTPATSIRSDAAAPTPISTSMEVSAPDAAVVANANRVSPSTAHAVDATSVVQDPMVCGVADAVTVMPPVVAPEALALVTVCEEPASDQSAMSVPGQIAVASRTSAPMATVI